MNTLKRKEIENSKQLKTPRSRELEKSTAKLPTESVWTGEISSISSMEFSSVDAALECIVDKVLSRFETREALYQESKNFLIQLLQDDEELLNKIQTVAKIG